MKQLLLLSTFFIFISLSTSYAQPGDDDLIQFSGVVITGDSLNPVPFTNVLIEQTGRGTMTDYYGYFSFVAQKGDSILFSAVGFKRNRFIIPDSLTQNKYSLIQIMNSDTVQLQETIVYPWPTREQFKEAFLAMEIPETDYDRAQKNLYQADMIARMDAAMPSGGETFKYSMQEYQQQIYYAGQAPPMNIFNPVAWGEFIQAWKRGDFKSDRERGKGQ
ncbi:carboxypeptidase-like regulatory domain-containing protein [Cryomorpha ignava]|uniref:Carboxypeptidase-like regulatory domain-containing protein n=1 Tax=Cryomorpha ignava TaxID=101383 RepID=A0A7K3WS17_9FLAO|nr:carboxypeptidase-like regulatory domain-containing protein [Cryomorpha ignava]NEN24470.1 carboxypeptidase-like regulatory domain-containing protein [Cryomorpha ignava]